jgi:hypothetical protein
MVVVLLGGDGGQSHSITVAKDFLRALDIGTYPNATQKPSMAYLNKPSSRRCCGSAGIIPCMP